MHSIDSLQIYKLNWYDFQISCSDHLSWPMEVMSRDANIHELRLGFRIGTGILYSWVINFTGGGMECLRFQKIHHTTVNFRQLITTSHDITMTIKENRSWYWHCRFLPFWWANTSMSSQREVRHWTKVSYRKSFGF